MRFIRGGEIRRHLQAETRFKEDRARFYAIQVALALRHLHSKNIIYRDLKPENILLDADGYICVADFGVSKILQGNEVASTMTGTAEYIAPEMTVRNPSYSF